MDRRPAITSDAPSAHAEASSTTSTVPVAPGRSATPATATPTRPATSQPPAPAAGGPAERTEPEQRHAGQAEDEERAPVVRPGRPPACPGRRPTRPGRGSHRPAGRGRCGPGRRRSLRAASTRPATATRNSETSAANWRRVAVVDMRWRARARTPVPIGTPGHGREGPESPISLRGAPGRGALPPIGVERPQRVVEVVDAHHLHRSGVGPGPAPPRPGDEEEGGALLAGRDRLLADAADLQHLAVGPDLAGDRHPLAAGDRTRGQPVEHAEGPGQTG